MPEVKFTLVEASQLTSLLPKFWFELRQLAGEGRRKSQKEDEKLLNEVMSLIVAAKPVSDWDGSISDQFLNLGFSVLRNSLTKVERDSEADAGTLQNLLRQADWLCSIAAASPQAPAFTKAKLCGLWVRSRLVQGIEESTVDSFLASATETLAPIGLANDAVFDQVRVQLVIRVSLLSSNGAATEELTSRAQAWCRELVAKSEFRTLLVAAARSLGVDVPVAPEVPVTVTPRIPTPERDEAQPSTIFVAPERLSEAELDQTKDLISIQLVAHSFRPDSPFTEQTKRQIRELGPSSGVAAINSTLYYAATNLWKAYWTRGERELLEEVRKLARYLYSSHTYREAKEHERSNSLLLWVSSQLPDRLLTCGVEDLFNDALQLSRNEGCKLNDLALREIIVEAFAGECRRLEKLGENAEREELLSEYGPSLRKIHEDYQQKSRAAGGAAWVQKAVNDELAAWDYLFPGKVVLPTSPVAPQTVPGQEKPVPPPVNRILDDPDFRTVINRGDHAETQQFAGIHFEKLQEMLQGRLKVHLGPEHVMMPEGRVMNPRGAVRNQEHPTFTEGKEALRAADYTRAATLFERLSDRVEGFNQDIACNYLAYAQAKLGMQMPARVHLNKLCSSGFTYSSAYWNLACCQLSNQMDQQLDALAKGLEVAPHPRLLEAAIYLGLFRNDPRLREWLPCLAVTEALLMWYLIEFEQISAPEREGHLMRLARYLMQGEPPVPDPLKDRLSENEISHFITALLDRQQPQAIEFWLRCRGLISRNRFDYWELKTDYLEKVGKAEEAAKAFREELRCRLVSLKNLFDRGEKNTFYPISQTRKRAEKWLAQCMTPDLKTIGFNLYNMLATFEAQHKTQLVPRTKKLNDWYGSPEPTPPQPSTQTGATPSAGSGGSAGADFNGLATTVAVESQSHLHDVSTLPRVRWRLEEFLRALRSQGSRGSAESFQKLLVEWEGYSRHTTESEKRGALQRAQTAYNELKEKLRKELTEQQVVLLAPLLNACQRVNERLVRDLKLLPELAAEGVEGGPVALDYAAEQSVFAVRVRAISGDTSVRLKNASATLDDGVTEFAIRDQLSRFPVDVGTGSSAILTFEGPAGFRLRGNGTVRLDLSYECDGAEYSAQSLQLQVTHRSCPAIPDRSPYIYGRRINPQEIEGHFFGREREQAEVFESVRDGQQRIRYIEGIRRAGKSSLLSSIECVVEKDRLPLIPVYLNAGETAALDHAGKVLFNFLETIAKNENVASNGVLAPEQQHCIDNAPSAYSRFVAELAAKMPSQRVLAMVDELQALIEAVAAARPHNPSFAQGIIGILNLIREYATPQAQLLWLFAGQKASRRYRDRDMLPGCLLWANWKALPIDFLTVEAVQAIIVEPLKGTNVVVPDETVARVHFLTKGHPEPVQQIAESMLLRATGERRWILTPSDADSAAQELANENDDSFADTWYPVSELTQDQQNLVAALINAIPVGGRVDLFRLAANNQVTEPLKAAVDDLVARKILDHKEDGTIGIRAFVLDLWLHRWIPRMVTYGGFHGNAAVFIDVANLTVGTGSNVLTDLATSSGEGLPGRFLLSTVLDRIEKYASGLSPAPITVRWASNYPAGSPAVVECNRKDYFNVNVPPELMRKGSDDVVLVRKIGEVEQQSRSVNHFVLVLGDKDYRETAEGLLKNGKFVHIVSRASALARSDTKYSYDYLAKQYPERFSVLRLEQLLDEGATRGPSR